MSNPALAAYEAAYDLLQDPSAFVASDALLYPAHFLFRLSGLDAPLACPLGAKQAAQITALYPGKVISAANILCEERYLDDHKCILGEIIDACLPRLAPSTTANVRLSHLVVDDVGDADLFCLQPSDDDDDEANATTFGMLIVLLPSAHTGGVLTFTYGDQSETLEDDTSLLETSFAAAYLSTTITSAPITSGRRVALVYRLYYGDADEPMRMKPNAQDAAIAAFQALGASTTHEVQRLGLKLEESHYYPLDFEDLMVYELEFVKVLLAAGNFDVGLARLSGDDTCAVEAFVPHPACNIPDAVVRGWMGHMLQGILHMPSPYSGAFECPSCVLVLWPKRHRVCLVDIEGISSFLTPRLERGDDDNDDNDGYLGICDTRELVLGAMPFFGVDGPVLVDVMTRVSYMDHRHSTLRDVQCQHFGKLFDTMQQLLTSRHDIALSAALLDVIAPTNVLSVAKIAPVVHGLVSQHGWEPLQASVLGLVRRWINSDPDATLQLLTSLAGLDSDAPVCPPLRQPFETELAKRCYDVVLSTPDLFTKREYYEGARGCKFVKGLFLLEHYITRTALQLQDAHYVSQRLPVHLVPVVDAFLFALHPSVASLFVASTGFHPLKDLAVGLASAVRCQPSLPLPPTVIDIILAAMRTPMERRVEINLASDHADVAAAVLVLASLTARLDATLFGVLWGIYDLQLLLIVASIASQLHDDALLSELVVSYIARSVTVVVDASKWRKPFDTDGVSRRMDVDRLDAMAYREAVYKFGADVFMSAVELLQRFAPYAVVAYTTRWLELQPMTLDALHDRLWPVLRRLDHHSSVYPLLRAAMLDRFAAEPALPSIVSFAIPPPRDLNPDHCDLCHNAHAFLARSDDATLMLFTNQRDVCANLSRVVNANVARLRMSRVDGTAFCLEKVRQPGQMSGAAWHVHHIKTRMHGRLAAYMATLTRSFADELQDNATTATKAPFAKRARRS